MKNTLTAMKDDLHALRRGLIAGTIDPKIAKEVSNVAGKTIGIAKVQLEGYHLRKEKPPIAVFK